MIKKRMTIVSAIVLTCVLFGGCATKNFEKNSTESVITTEENDSNVNDEVAKETALPDGQYSVDFDTDSSMFHVNEACDGKGTLNVENGEMTVHISLVSKNIQNLYQGLAEDAVKEGAELLNPTKDKVTYSDGFTEEVYGFDVPVPVLNQEFDLALIGTKGKWYDHKVIVSNPEPIKELESESNMSTYRLASLSYKGSMELQYASNFSVDYYEDGYKLLKLIDGTKLLMVPKDKETPSGLEKDVIVLHQPVQNLYLVSSSVMDIFDKLDAMDTIRFSGQKEENWYVEAAKEAMKSGKILYAGKYNKPDYELLVSQKCSLAIENNMISHSPEVIEMLQDFDIPVMIEYSSYESHPLGRVEWIKFFGALVDKEEEAEQIFEKQISILDEVTKEAKTDKTVAFFFITSNGLVQVRQSSDYVPKMIELAGGRYIFSDLGNSESKRSTLNMQIEEFYDGAKDADYLIYNSSIDGGVNSINELIDKCPVLKDFKAVKNGNVWCTTNDMYQQSMSIGYMIEDIHGMLQGDREEDMKYLFRLK